MVTWPLMMAVAVTMRVLPSGRVTVVVTLLAVLGPLLVIVTTAVMVWPGVAFVGIVIAMARSATGLATTTAVAVFAFEPTDVTKDPDERTFVSVPETELVTTDVITQLEPGDITVPVGSDKDPAPAAAVTEPDVQPTLLATAGVVFTKPTGYVSVNCALRVADVRALVLDIVIDRRAVPPTLILVTEKLLDTVGVDWVTASMSETVHVPPAQAALVLVTLTGGDTTAVFVTPVCALAATVTNKHNTSDEASVTTR